MKCGHPNSSVANVPARQASDVSASMSEKWWFRLAKVFYIVLYFPLIITVWVVWSINSSSYDYASQTYTDTTGLAFWYSLIALVICLIIVRLIKITFLYIALGRKAEWKKEFRKIF
jgi:hypothetical protein